MPENFQFTKWTEWLHISMPLLFPLLKMPFQLMGPFIFHRFFLNTQPVATPWLMPNSIIKLNS